MASCAPGSVDGMASRRSGRSGMRSGCADVLIDLVHDPAHDLVAPFHMLLVRIETHRRRSTPDPRRGRRRGGVWSVGDGSPVRPRASRSVRMAGSRHCSDRLMPAQLWPRELGVSRNARGGDRRFVPVSGAASHSGGAAVRPWNFRPSCARRPILTSDGAVQEALRDVLSEQWPTSLIGTRWVRPPRVAVLTDPPSPKAW
jgi:hypothetical protein